MTKISFIRYKKVPYWYKNLAMVLIIILYNLFVVLPQLYNYYYIARVKLYF